MFWIRLSERNLPKEQGNDQESKTTDSLFLKLLCIIESSICLADAFGSNSYHCFHMK